jgi:PPOX class probable F420-dependent enzyme
VTSGDAAAWVASALAAAPVGRLATTAADGTVHLVPICFAVVDGHIASAVDHKPKRTNRLQRLADIGATGRATFLVDHYDDDWSQLWWVRAEGTARVLDPGDDESSYAVSLLARRYPQYVERPPGGAVLAVDVTRWSGWSA